MIRTSGPVSYSEVKGLLHNNTWWWCETGIVGQAFRLLAYGTKASELMSVTHMTQSGRLNIAPGYLWDGTSRPVVRGQTKVDVAPSLVHDVLCEAVRAGKLDPSNAKAMDGLYYKMLRERGVLWIKAAARRAVLFLFGWTARRRSRGPEYPRRVAR